MDSDTNTGNGGNRLSVEGLGALMRVLQEDGYTLMGPTVRDAAVVISEIRSLEDLPRGVGETQDAGTYRLTQRDDGAFFGFSSGPQSWKASFFVPKLQLFQIRRKGNDCVVEKNASTAKKVAVIGARSCDVHAMAIQDRVFLEGAFQEQDYAARRSDAFVVAVQCGQAGGTCFCVSMNTGPKVEAGFDLALTEIIEGDAHYFLVEVGTERGRMILQQVPTEPAETQDWTRQAAILDATASSMGRTLNTLGIKELLYRNFESARWDAIAERCLSCANCTMVCPTCFCSTVTDSSDLSGETAERTRHWDSCFSMDHSYVHGGSVRASTSARYRQWMTHKFASWIDQFGSSGCVGCGRCVTWCPVGIDVTQELAAIRSEEG